MSDQQQKVFGAKDPDGGKGQWVAGIIAVLLLGVALLSLVKPSGNDVPAAPEPSPNGTYSLTVETQPAGASLMLNGRLVGATPVVLAGLQPGRYGVRLEKDGYKPLLRSVEMSEKNTRLTETLDVLPAGLLSIDIQPRGAEVLIDGEVVGHTPLKSLPVPVGSYELLIRKTNFDSYAKRVEIQPIEELAFAGFELKDKVRGMLEGLLKTEPQRVGHYLDLGHYLFVNDFMDEAVETFTQASDVLQAPLDFDGAGYPGRARLTLAEMQNEERLRREDEQRFQREMDKHKTWPGKNTRLFREKLEEAQELSNRKNIASWMWADQYARHQRKSGMLEKAAQTYVNHIEAVTAKNDPKDANNLQLAYAALLEVHLLQRDVQRVQSVFEKIMTKYNNDGVLLRGCGSFIATNYDRMVGSKDRNRVLEMAERALRRALEIANDPADKGAALFDLGAVLMNQSRPADAVPVFQQAADAVADVPTKEDRLLRVGDALRKSGNLNEARELYKKLSDSERKGISAAARAGLIYVQADEARKNK